MNYLSSETKNIQNPALGALLLWRFAVGFEEKSQTRNHPPIPLLYLVLPILLHEETESLIKSTLRSSGLRALVNKFSSSANAKNDLIFSIQDRAVKMKNLTTNSLKQALTSKLLSIVPEKGITVPLSTTPPKFGISGTIKDLMKQAEKLGIWCADLSLYEIAIILKVGF